MKLKKLLALTLTGAMLTASLTACTPLDAAEVVYDAIFGGGGSSSTGSNNGGTASEEAQNRAVAEAFVQWVQSDDYVGYVANEFGNVNPIVYDIPNLEEFVAALDVYCTELSERNNKSWEENVCSLSDVAVNYLQFFLIQDGARYGQARATLWLTKDVSGTPEQQAKSFRDIRSFWDNVEIPYRGPAWFDTVVLTRADGSQYRFLLSICQETYDD